MIIYCDGHRDKICYVPEGRAGTILPFEGQSHNEAEHVAIQKALEYAMCRPEPHVFEIFSDSELAIKQLKGEYQIKDPALYEQAAKTLQMVDRLSEQGKVVLFHWVHREENKAGLLLE